MEVQIYASKGFNNGIFIEHVASHPGESEFLMNAAQKFEILEVSIEDVATASYAGASKVKNFVVKVVPIIE